MHGITAATDMFAYCRSLITCPSLNTSECDNFQEMFYECSALTNVPTLDVYKAVYMDRMFLGCSELEEITFPRSTAYVTRFSNVFNGCVKLKRINGTLSLSRISSTSYLANPFSAITYNAKQYPATTLLEEVRISGLRVNMSFSSLVNLSHESLVYLINGLSNYTSGTHTLTIGSTNLAKLTEEEIAVGTNKGWTIK